MNETHQCPGPPLTSLSVASSSLQLDEQSLSSSLYGLIVITRQSLLLFLPLTRDTEATGRYRSGAVTLLMRHRQRDAVTSERRYHSRSNTLASYFLHGGQMSYPQSKNKM